MKLWKQGLLVAALTMMASAAWAQYGYAGASVGMVAFTRVDDVRGLEGTDDRLAAGSVFVGAQLNDWVGIEGGYLRTVKGDMCVYRNCSLDYYASSFYAALVGTLGALPTRGGGAVAPYVKAGVNHWKAEVSAAAGSTRVSFAADDTDLLLGAGLRYDVGDQWAVQWSIRAEYMRLEADTHAVLVGVMMRFGE